MTAEVAVVLREGQLPEQMERVQRFLAETTSVADIARLHDLAEAARRYADSHAAQNYAAEVKLRCARRGGELLDEMARNKDRAASGKESQLATLSDLGVDKSSSHRWQRMATIPADQFETYVADTDEVTAAGLLRLAKDRRPPRNTERRNALPAKAAQAAGEFQKATDRLVRIVDDDRFAANRDQIALHLRPALEYALYAIQRICECLEEGDPA